MAYDDGKPLALAADLLQVRNLSALRLAVRAAVVARRHRRRHRRRTQKWRAQKRDQLPIHA